MRLDPFSPAYSRDPAAAWRRLLATGYTVGYDPALDLWLIGGHDNVRTVLADTDRFSNAATLAPIQAASPQTRAVLAGIDARPVSVTADRPEHLRTRAVLRALFPTTPARASQQWGPIVAARTEELITSLAGRGTVDLMHFSVQLPLRVILDVLGLPASDAADIQAWTDDFAHLVWGNPTPDEQLACARSCVALWQYCQHTVEHRAAATQFGGGIVGDLLRYRNEDDAKLTVAEVAALTLNIVGAGSETTAAALGNALRHALAEPGRWARLARDDQYLAGFVEETLRHCPAIDGWLRLTLTDVTLDQVTIPAGSRCLVPIGTAGHDRDVYSQPHVFDPTRPRAGQHLAFGAGSHHCIGAALARLELTTALHLLARRVPNLTVDTSRPLTTRPSAALRQHRTMPAHPQQTGSCPIAHPSTEAGIR
ncbi:cytochrome P450 [Actinoplanes sp. NPDC000266]